MIDDDKLEIDEIELDKDRKVIEFNSYFKDTSDSEDIEDAEQQIKAAIKKLKIKKIVIISSILLFLAILFVFFRFYMKNRRYSNIEIRYSRLKSEVFAGYTNLDENLVRYGKDGAILVDGSGKEVWNTSYNMKHPIVNHCGKYLLISDLNGNFAYLFDKSGSLCSVTSSYPITDIRVSDTGIFMLISENEEMTYISFYSKDGKILAESQYPLAKKRFPVCFDLSYNGFQAAIGFIGYDKTELISQIAVLGFDQESATKPNNVISSLDLGNEIPISLEYNSGGQLLLLTDKGIRSLMTDNKDKKINEIIFEKAPKSVLYNDKFIVYVIEKDKKKIAKFFDYSGKEISEIELVSDYEQIILNEDLLVMTEDDEMSAYDVKGKLRFKHILNGKIKDIKAMNNRLKYLVVYDGNMEFIVLK